MTETIGTIKAIPGIITLSPVIRNKFGLDGTKVEKNNTKMFAPHMGAILSVTSSSQHDTMSSWNSSSLSIGHKIKGKSR